MEGEERRLFEFEIFKRLGEVTSWLSLLHLWVAELLSD